MNADNPSPTSAARIWLARGIAATADLVQIALLPFFAEGVLSPFNDALDVVMAVVMTLLVGWHLAFLPSFVVELMPVADLAPTWTIAVLIATRRTQRASSGPLGACCLVAQRSPGGPGMTA